MIDEDLVSAHKTPPDRTAPLLELRSVSQEFRVPAGRGRAVLSAMSDVSFVIIEGQTLGLVGESGSGKSTTARAIVQAPRPTTGQVLLRGVDLARLHGSALGQARRQVQMVFQDPYASLDPRWKVSDIVGEPLLLSGRGSRRERAGRVDELLDLVGLDPRRFGERRPYQLSGGQAQRVGIARALALSPALVICDEAVSSLDVSIQAQVLNLLERLRREMHLTYLFISHDLAVVKHVSDWVAVMYLGRICEIGRSDDIYKRAAHPYTASLLGALPDPNINVRVQAGITPPRGEMPSPLNPPSGCRYRTRCPRAQQRCADEIPQLREQGNGQRVACHFPLSSMQWASDA
jgi:oligopeptide/dipeptide ABC transporter ATP-binding protein